MQNMGCESFTGAHPQGSADMDTMIIIIIIIIIIVF